MQHSDHSIGNPASPRLPEFPETVGGTSPETDARPLLEAGARQDSSPLHGLHAQGSPLEGRSAWVLDFLRALWVDGLPEGTHLPATPIGDGGAGRTTSLVLALCAAGCVPLVRAYAGDRLPADRTAVLVGVESQIGAARRLANPELSARVRFLAVDGFPIELPTKIEVPAGETTLECRVSAFLQDHRERTHEDVTVTFFAQAGEWLRVVPVLAADGGSLGVNVETEPGLKGSIVVGRSDW